MKNMKRAYRRHKKQVKFLNRLRKQVNPQETWIGHKHKRNKEDIIKGQKGQNFKEVYQDLSLEDKRYMKADLINGQGDRGLIVVIDLKEQKVLKSFEIIKIGIGG